MKQEQEEEQNYTIKFIPPAGSEIKTIHLSANILKYGLISLAVGAMLFVGAFSYAVYSTFVTRSSAAEIQDLREVNNIQQEQLLQLAKKANALQDQLDQLKQLENDLRRLTGATPLKDDDDKAGNASEGTHDGQGGPVIKPDVENVGTALDMVEKDLNKRRESLLDLEKQLKSQQAQLVAVPVNSYVPGGIVPAIWPARGDVSSPYGLRWNGSDFHPGIDIANDMGTPIVATADGLVVTAGWNDGGYGNMVDIDHGNGIMTRYGHAMQVVVVPGQRVKRGQLIAYMGSTGFSTGPHVHYEVRVNGQTVNPWTYLH